MSTDASPAARPRLSRSTLSALAAGVARPDYDVGAVRTGIVHLGLGAFHRAHQAVYTDGLLAHDPRWGICGVSLKTPRSTAALAAQDGLYCVAAKGEGTIELRVVGSLREALFLGDDRDRVIARIADPAVSVVTLTVTEKGYCHDPATGRLDRGHPDIVHDLAHPDAPVSAIGVLVAGLAARRAASGAPVNVVSCDNLPHNGRTAEGIVSSFAQARDGALAAWIAAHVAFPCTMVDRIVPAVRPADIEEVARLAGVDDAVPVVAEPYRCWVIENRFVAERPAWEDAGAQIVDDVAPFETMKLRLLNASHSTLAYLGYLAGHDTIWQASNDPQLAALIRRMMDTEIVPTLVAPPGIDLHAYCAELVARFRNPTLPHRTQQIAMDGSQKIPPRLLSTARARIARGASFDHVALAVAGWIRYASGVDEHGAPIRVDDPMAAEFAAIATQASGDPARLARGFLDLAAVFGADLSGNAAFRETVTRDVATLVRDGVHRTLEAHNALSSAD